MSASRRWPIAKPFAPRPSTTTRTRSRPAAAASTRAPSCASSRIQAKGFEFDNEIKGGSIPKEFIPAVEKGVRESLEGGILAGYPMVDIKVELFDGAYHDVDSSEMAFKICSSICFKEACRKAKPVLLEPVMRVEVVVPEEYMGTVNGDLISRRGRLEGTEVRGTTQLIKAMVPLSEMFGYATELRSRTQGRGSFTMHFGQYEEVPKNLSEEIVAKVQGRVTK